MYTLSLAKHQKMRPNIRRNAVTAVSLGASRLFVSCLRRDPNVNKTEYPVLTAQ